MTKKKDNRYKVLRNNPLFIGVCGSCEWYITSSDPEVCLKSMNEHCKDAHGNETDDLDNMEMFVSTETVQIERVEKKELVLEARGVT